MIYEPVPQGKPCSKCGKWKLLKEFYKHPQCRDGHIGVCKACKASYYQDNRPNKTAYQRTYWHQNADRYLLYVSRNRDKTRPQRRRYHLAYRQAHRNEGRAQKLRRKARTRSLPHAFTASDWQRALDYFNGCCAVCGRPPGLWHTIAADHWIPLSSPDCPGTIPGNIVPLCHGVDGCNNSKSDRSAEQWLRETVCPRKTSQILERIRSYFEKITIR